MFTHKQFKFLVLSLLTVFALLITGCTATIESTAGPTPTPTEGQCAFVWATQNLEESSEKLQTALDEAGLTIVTGNAGVFGENCVNEDGTIQGFAARDVDIYLSFTVDNLEDTAALGSLAIKATEVLMALPAETFPKTIDFVNYHFTDGTNSIYAQQTYTGLVALMESKPTGQDFYNAIQKPAPF